MNICGLCDQSFPPDHVGKDIYPITWYCDGCGKKHDKEMIKMEKERIESWNFIPPEFDVLCRRCDEAMIGFKRDKSSVDKMLDDPDFDLCMLCRIKKDKDLK